MTAWLALSLTIEGELDQQELVDGVSRWVEVMRLWEGRRNVPLPFDHFFFCFLPADAAAGA